MIFSVCNIPKFIKDKMEELKNPLCSDMNEDNRDGFDYAVDNCVRLLKELVHAAEVDGEILVHSEKIKEDCEIEEFDLNDLLKLFDCRVIAQKESKEE